MAVSAVRTLVLLRVPVGHSRLYSVEFYLGDACVSMARVQTRAHIHFLLYVRRDK